MIARYGDVLGWWPGAVLDSSKVRSVDTRTPAQFQQ